MSEGSGLSWVGVQKRVVREVRNEGCGSLGVKSVVSNKGAAIRDKFVSVRSMTMQT